MTGRSRRNPDIISLQVHGLSRSLLDKHPPPDHIEDPESFIELEESSRYPPPVSTSHQHQSTVSPDGGIQSFTDTSTGNTTDRSSVDDPFWGNDESERKAARKIQQLFEQIDRVLYEQQTHEVHRDLVQECAEWTFQFPHLRILGHQLVPPQEKGYEEIPRTSISRPSTASTLQDEPSQLEDMAHLESDFHLLNVTGKAAEVTRIKPPDSAGSFGACSSSSQESVTGIFEEEEIFEQDGYIEEIIAVDYPDRMDNVPDRWRPSLSSSQHHRTGYPPITPLACVRDSIASATFDYTWTEVLTWMRSLLNMYYEYVLVVKSILVPLPSYHTDTNSLSREPASICQKSSLPVRNHSFLSGSSTCHKQHSLDGILTVKPKEIVERSGPILHDISEGGQLQLGSGCSNPHPQSFKASRPASVKYNRHVKLLRLAPLHNVQDRSKTPSVDEEVLKVTKLMPAGSECQSSPPGSFGHRNGCLPPIYPDVTFESPVTRLLPMRRFGGFNSRVSSAMGDKDLRSTLLQRERSALSVESRPSTTHATARSDTPLLVSRRSSTPPWQQSFSTRGHSVIGTQAVTLGISGSGLQPPHITDTIHQHLPLSQAEIREDDELHEEDVSTSWAPANSSKGIRRPQPFSPTVHS